jgi:hypothetical protein
MKLWLEFGAAMAVAAAAGSATAGPGVIIHDAAARVTVIPDARNDVSVEVVRSNPHFRITVTKIGDDVSVDGGLGFRGHNCRNKGVSVWGVGFVPYQDLPQIVVRTPMNVRVKAGGAVFGVVGRADSTELGNSGCGDWTVANVAGPADVRVSGSGDVRVADVGSADVRISGSANVVLGDVRGGLAAATSGSGDVSARTVNGPLHVRVAGSGDVTSRGGQVTNMFVSIAGSGDVKFGGVAQSLDASVAGSGDVFVSHVVGPVSKHIAGSGSVRVGG